MQSSTIDGRTIRFLNIVDEYTRQCLSIKVGRSITSEDAIDTLAELFAMHGVPKRLRCDNARAWREDFNERRPHSSLSYLTPSEFAIRSSAEVRPWAERKQSCESPATVPQPNLS